MFQVDERGCFPVCLFVCLVVFFFFQLNYLVP